VSKVRHYHSDIVQCMSCCHVLSFIEELPTERRAQRLIILRCSHYKLMPDYLSINVELITTIIVSVIMMKIVTIIRQCCRPIMQ